MCSWDNPILRSPYKETCVKYPKYNQRLRLAWVPISVFSNTWKTLPKLSPDFAARSAEIACLTPPSVAAVDKRRAAASPGASTLSPRMQITDESTPRGGSCLRLVSFVAQEVLRRSKQAVRADLDTVFGLAAPSEIPPRAKT